MSRATGCSAHVPEQDGYDAFAGRVQEDNTYVLQVSCDPWKKGDKKEAVASSGNQEQRATVEAGSTDSASQAEYLNSNVTE